MTVTAVVSGSAARVDDVARAIERRGITVLRICRGDDLSDLAALADRTLHYYVQLPGDVPSPSTTRASALRALFGGVMGRFGELDVVLPKLAVRSAVVLVTGEIVEDLSWRDYPHAPTCVLEMLADAVATDLSPSQVRATVVSHRQSADEIADITLSGGPERVGSMVGYAALAPEMSYDDWRLACLSHTGPED